MSDYQDLEVEADSEAATTATDSFEMDISVYVTETETEERDTEFIEALEEIEGKKSYPCEKWEKFASSKVA